MSFQEPKSAIAICNKALSRIRQQPLQGSLTDPANLNKHAARECNTWYKTIVRQVLSQHHWGLATKRVGLVLSPSNNRSGEWPYAYLPPSDMAFPVMIGPVSDALGVSNISYYRGLGYLIATAYNRPIFRFESKTIFAFPANAVLDYVSFDITEQDFNEAVEALVVLYLASQLAHSVAKDDQLAKDLHNEALARQNIEIAQNFNMNQPRYDHQISDTELARQGLDPTLRGLGFYG